MPPSSLLLFIETRAGLYVYVYKKIYIADTAGGSAHAGHSGEFAENSGAPVCFFVVDVLEGIDALVFPVDKETNARCLREGVTPLGPG